MEICYNDDEYEMKRKTMKTIGLLGGMSWESTLEYYRLINLEIKQKLGGSHSAKILMYSFDYHELEQLLVEKRWDEITKLLIQAARSLKQAGAELLVMCANTMHIVADAVEKGAELPLIHIVKSTLEQAKSLGLSKLALLGTMYTMESPLYPTLFKSSGLDIILPSKREMALIHRTIYHELILGMLKDSSRDQFLSIINRLRHEGAQGVILGCTEIPLLIQPDHLPGFVVLDTLKIHAKAAAEYAMSEQDDL
jgi:aspartate racemase